MDPFSMVVAIVAISSIAGVLKAKHGARRAKGDELSPDQASPDADRLRDEVKQLKERIAVLERITVDKENSLAREIEQLRDR